MGRSLQLAPDAFSHAMEGELTRLKTEEPSEEWAKWRMV
jgi:hypothetical protein